MLYLESEHEGSGSAVVKNGTHNTMQYPAGLAGGAASR